MYLSGFNVLLADAAPATTTSTSAAANSPANQQQPGMGSLLIPMALFAVLIYFMMIRPQSQQRKKQAQLLETLKSGDKIVTHSGIHGVVITVKDKTVSIRSHESKMEVAKSSVVEILERDGDAKSEKSS